ncbi:MAG: TerD domain-containing protein [Desulfovibrio sp.]|nr:TerD domain-containing protein [Desulfovibrio sp.]
MTKLLIKGEKIKLEDIGARSAFNVGVACRVGTESPDISCFGIDAEGKLSDDRYFIFYNQKSSPEKALIAMGRNGEYDEVFSLDLGRLPKSVVRLVFTATLDSGATFAQAANGRLDILSQEGTTASYAFSGKDFSQEKAVIIGEIYLKTVWRFSAVGQGFNGGLSALLSHFGGKEVGAAPSPPPAAEEQKVKLSKVRLDKQGATHKVSLSKAGGQQIFHINLQWDQPPPGQKQGGFLGKLLGGGGGGADLDLGCMWRDRHGNQGVIQPLGENFGSKDSPPYIFLDKDDRSGAAADGENMHIFRPDEMDTVVVFALIYEGTANFSTVNARLTISDGKGGEILVPLNTPDPRRTFCAVALITNDGTSIRFRKEELYFPGHKDCDQHYGFGFRWTAGRK